MSDLPAEAAVRALTYLVVFISLIFILTHDMKPKVKRVCELHREEKQSHKNAMKMH